MKRKERFFFAYEPAVGFRLPHGEIGGDIVFQSGRQVSDTTRLAHFAGGEYLDTPTITKRTQINQDAVRHEDSVNFTQGMHHARMGNSSERPGEDGDVEGLFAERDGFGVRVDEADLVCQV